MNYKRNVFDYNAVGRASPKEVDPREVRLRFSEFHTWGIHHVAQMHQTVIFLSILKMDFLELMDWPSVPNCCRYQCFESSLVHTIVCVIAPNTGRTLYRYLINGNWIESLKAQVTSCSKRSDDLIGCLHWFNILKFKEGHWGKGEKIKNAFLHSWKTAKSLQSERKGARNSSPGPQMIQTMFVLHNMCRQFSRTIP